MKIQEIQTKKYEQMNIEKNELKLYIEDYLIDKGININTNFPCLNPNHLDKNPSMGYNKLNKTCHCFACECTYDIFSLVGIDYNISNFKDQIAKVKELYKNQPIKINNYQNNNKNNYQIETETIELNLDYQIEYYHRQLMKSPEHLKHYLDRGLSLDIIKEYKLGYSSQGHNSLLEDYEDYMCKSKKDSLYNYILPYKDENDYYNYYTSEISDRNQIDNYNSKYRKINKGKHSPFVICPLFNERYLKQNISSIIFVTEGIYDALSVEEVGGKAIALNGVGQNRILNLCSNLENPPIFIILRDNDNAGEKASNRLEIGFNNLHIKNVTLTVPTYKDANECLVKDREKFKQFINNTIELYNPQIITENEIQLIDR